MNVKRELLKITDPNQVLDVVINEDRADTDFCAHASNLVCLQKLRELQFEWDELTIMSALDENKDEILAYALEEGCPFSLKDAFKECSLNWGADTSTITT